MISTEGILANKQFLVWGVILLLAIFLLWFQQDRRLNSMSGPKDYPLIGIGLSLSPRATSVFRGWALEYGEIFKLRVGWYNWVVINSPEAMKEIFKQTKELCLGITTRK